VVRPVRNGKRNNTLALENLRCTPETKIITRESSNQLEDRLVAESVDPFANCLGVIDGVDSLLP
jgi:hypothetical protein